MNQEYKYFAFISYNSKDVKWGSRLQRKLEGYKMSAALCSEKGLAKTPLKPIFFAPTDIQPNDLDDEIRARLQASRHLIVICSPNSAKSEWVGKEIAFFHSLGRKENIHFFIVDGAPNTNDPNTECFNPAIKRLGMDNVLGANINERNYSWRYLNVQRAYVQLITKLLGVEFDTLWQRHKRQLRAKWLTAIVLILVIVGTFVCVWNTYRPVTVSVSLEEVTVANPNLPALSDAEITLVLGDDVRSVRVSSLDQVATFTNVPKALLGSDVELRFVDFPDVPGGENYHPVTTTMCLSETMSLPISRDTMKYGMLKTRLVDRNYRSLPNYTIDIEGMSFTSDANGNIDAYISQHLQRESYVVMNDTLRNVGLSSRLLIVVE